MIEVYSGEVQAWECDAMGHMNLHFHVARATAGLASAQSAMAVSFLRDMDVCGSHGLQGLTRGERHR